MATAPQLIMGAIFRVCYAIEADFYRLEYFDRFIQSLTLNEIFQSISMLTKPLTFCTFPQIRGIGNIKLYIQLIFVSFKKPFCYFLLSVAL